MKPIVKGAAVVAASCLALAVVPRIAKSADHLDGPATTADHTADINDVYTWMDGSNAVFVMTVYPAAPAGALFSDKTQYVFHTTSSASFGAMETNKDIICTFTGAAAPQTISCWLGATDEFVQGNADVAAGIASTDGKMKVFAGLRKDPFFFNLAGFKATAVAVEQAAPSLAFDAGCPAVDAPTSSMLVNKLKTNTDPDGGTPAPDFFKDLNTLAIVVSVDKSLVTAGGAIVSTWGATYKVP